MRTSHVELAVDSRTVLAPEVEEFELALPDVCGSLIRSGEGNGPSCVSVRDYGAVTSAKLEIGYPMIGQVAVNDDSLVAAVVLDLDAPARWDGIELRRGQVFVYPPGGLQQAVDSDGMVVGMVTASVDAVAAAAEALGRSLDNTEHRVIEGRAADQLLEFNRIASCGDRGRGRNLVLEMIVSLLTSAGRHTNTRRTSASRKIVAAVNEHLDETCQWQASMLSLCQAVGVSERRLQLAFRDVYDVSPIAYVRSRALSHARTQLLGAARQERLVTTVAHDHGFRHLGRFAAYYRDAFGQLPSETVLQN